MVMYYDFKTPEEMSPIVSREVSARMSAFVAEFCDVAFTTRRDGDELHGEDLLWDTCLTRAIVRCAEQGMFSTKWRVDDMKEWEGMTMVLSKDIYEGDGPLDPDDAAMRITYRGRTLTFTTEEVSEFMTAVEDAFFGEAKVVTPSPADDDEEIDGPDGRDFVTMTRDALLRLAAKEWGDRYATIKDFLARLCEPFPEDYRFPVVELNDEHIAILFGADSPDWLVVQCDWVEDFASISAIATDITYLDQEDEILERVGLFHVDPDSPDDLE